MKPFDYRGWRVSYENRWYRATCGHHEPVGMDPTRNRPLIQLLSKIDEIEDRPKECPSGYGGACYFVRGCRDDGLQTEVSFCCHCGRAFPEPLR
jgi:hypothetical protein|tara:strand:+ start:4016 stop:4297 length:282 start_codon:yes stop_codon:yes gene_type:complete